MSRINPLRRIKLRGTPAVPASVLALENPFPAIGPPFSVDPSSTNIRRPSNRASTYKPDNEHPGSQFPHTLEPAA
jgi:hypothetical protein